MTENTHPHKNERHLKTVAKGAGLVFFGLVFSKILTYFYRLIIARYYGPQDYGLISIGLSVIGVIVPILVLGMDAGLTRYIPEFDTKNDQRRLKGVILTPFKISLPVSIAAVILCWFLSPFMAGLFAKDIVTQLNLTMIFQIFSLTIPFTVCYNFLLATNRGFQKIEYNVYSDNIFFSIILVSTVTLFFFLGLGIFGLAWAYAITVITSFLFIFYFFNRRVFKLFSRDVKAVFDNRKLLMYSIPVLIGVIANTIIGYSDTIFLGIFSRNIGDVGIYNAALPTAKFILVFGSAFSALFWPIMVEYKTKKMKRETQAFYKTVNRWVFFLGFPLVLLLVFFSKNILTILFGSEYAIDPASFALSVLGLAFFIQSIFMTSSIILLVLDRTKYVMMNVVLAALINIALNVLLIPSFGIVGAATSTTISILFLTMLDSFFAWRFTRMNPLAIKAVLKSVFSGAVSMIFIMLIYRLANFSASLVTMLPLFILFNVLYFALLIVFRALDKDDVFIIMEIEKKLGVRTGFIGKFFKRFVNSSGKT